jgi:hypothetical protein
MAGFLLAYLASAVSPGTLDHIQLILPFVRSFPDILLWYGLLAGISSKGSLGRSADELARRVLRELERDSDFLTAPSCDIALSELFEASGLRRKQFCAERGWPRSRF